jgi:hypothetical protein
MSQSNLAEKQESVNRKDPAYLGDDFGGRLDLTYSWDRSTDKLARQMYMPRGLRPKNAAFGTGGKGKTAPAPKKTKLHVVPKTSEPGQRPKVTSTDLVDGRKFGKRIVTLRRKQGKRSCQAIGKRFFEIATKNIGRGQVFYLAAGYGILESR